MFKYLSLLSILLAGSLISGSARAGAFACPAPLDCAAFPSGCIETRYGLHQPDSLLKEADPLLVDKVDRGDPGAALLTSSDFGGTFAYNRGNGRPGCDPVGNEVACECGGEDGHIAIFGTFIVQELAGCDPFDPGSEGWGTGGGDGCPAVIINPFTAGGRPEHFFTEARVIASQPIIGFDPMTGPITTQLHISVASQGSNCGAGRRMDNPDPAAAADSTRIQWDFLGTPGGTDSFICCNSPDAPLNICSTIAGIGVPRYPAVPSLAGFGGPYGDFPDWVFAGGRMTNWETDTNHILPNQRYGVCESTRDIPCDCGEGSACLGAQIVTADNPCPNLDADPGTAGIQPDACDLDDFVCAVNRDTACSCSDYSCYPVQANTCATFCPNAGAGPTACTTDDDCVFGSCSELNDPTCDNPCPAIGERCDLREIGWRLSAETRLDPDGTSTPADPTDDGDPNPNVCANTLYQYRGFPEEFCTLSVLYDVNGDPGPDCSTLNYRVHFRPDEDCNGVDDTAEGANPPGDLCPLFTETNLLGDADGNGRGDSCECGDANRDGFVNVTDILTVNDLIFNDPGAGTGWAESNDPFFPSKGYKRLWVPLADATNNPTEDSTPGNPSDPNFLWDTGGDVNVSDILKINGQIFEVAQSSCSRYPICGDGSVDVGNSEGCDDGDNASGDGCDNACEVEFGFTCSGQPSVCTPN